MPVLSLEFLNDKEMLLIKDIFNFWLTLGVEKSQPKFDKALVQCVFHKMLIQGVKNCIVAWDIV